MQHLCLLAKHWTPGKVKTRLAASIGDCEAADCFREFVGTLLSRLAAVAEARSLVYWPLEEREAFAAIAGAGWRVEPQSAGGLGERMRALFDSKITSQNDCCVLLGCDSPNVPTEYIEQAFTSLKSARLVLGPTDDGGYYLIGARGEVPPVLDDMPYSTPELWAETIERLTGFGWAEGTDYVILPPWYDVDTAADLARLRRELAESVVNDPHLAALAQRLPPF